MAKTEVEVVIKGTDKASGVFKGIGISAKKMGVAMTAVGVAAIGMGVASVKAFAAAGDEVQKMALRTSFSTEALSELKHAAELSGASLNTIEKASKKLSKAMVDASDGLETYKRAFDKLGLSTADLMKLSPEEQFNAVSQALADLENETLKVALAQDLFGRAGTQLLPMLEQGAEGIKDMRQEA
ncbi:MAG: hypothetical protein KAS32_27810, partial [Candidatus Peribacteraceae bacterium]|nr:hypothetical protein [Candidatus Peribacteraceae bacterium]